MAIKIVESEVLDITAKGKLRSIDADGLTVEDEKTGIRTLDWAKFQHLVGQEINFKLTNKKIIND